MSISDVLTDAEKAELKIYTSILQSNSGSVFSLSSHQRERLMLILNKIVTGTSSDGLTPLDIGEASYGV